MEAEYEDEIVNDFQSDNQEQIENIENHLPILKEEKDYLKKEIKCPKFNKIKVLVNSNTTIDKIIQPFSKFNPYHNLKHYSKTVVNFDNIKVSINKIYYLDFYCYIKNYGIIKNLNEKKRFEESNYQSKPNNSTIIKIYRINSKNYQK